ncbi:hypothetical protein V1J52_19120 [Streptomyces sp. TRM 70351]|uniref:hypothetical protein n=1 Tax=Streptomyces sp. TRM 70351 TaxID=3116552 RepID=UPI002E7BF3F5|nr:hypothetical protein [Streptomyces sp. TRM 70351]MEE1930268.1 hypothetical protein [Streptomyces sp. TRM 70351]
MAGARTRCGIAAVAAAAVLLAGCGDGTSGGGEGGSTGGRPAERADKPQLPQVIGDGSTAFTGVQPHQPKPARLQPGERPPQFVVFSWDGAGEDGKELFSHFREVGGEYGAHMTYFLSGVYLLPEDEALRYDPPGHRPGASDIGYLKDENIRATLDELRAAWLDGSEIGTHFNGHFCGPTGVESWSVEDWKSEIRQAKWFVRNWKTTTGWQDADPLPFDYERELAGGRTPCLEGRENLVEAARDMGFRYDSSGIGRQVWPAKDRGLWDLPLQLVPMPGRDFETLSMDYNFMVNQSGPGSGDPAMHPYWEQQMRDGLLQGFERAYRGNRAPMIIGNHFNGWNGGIYMRAVEDVIKTVCVQEEVRCVSFRQLVDWLDAQDPRVLRKLRTLGVGEQPRKGWGTFLASAPRAAGGDAADGSGGPGDS